MSIDRRADGLIDLNNPPLRLLGVKCSLFLPRVNVFFYRVLEADLSHSLGQMFLFSGYVIDILFRFYCLLCLQVSFLYIAFIVSHHLFISPFSFFSLFHILVSNLLKKKKKNTCQLISQVTSRDPS